MVAIIVTGLASVVFTVGVYQVIAQNMSDMSTTNMTGTNATSGMSANQSGTVSGFGDL